jgi:hypothetical protein
MTCRNERVKRGSTKGLTKLTDAKTLVFDLIFFTDKPSLETSKPKISAHFDLTVKDAAPEAQTGLHPLQPASACHTISLACQPSPQKFFYGGGIEDFGRTSVVEKTLFQTYGDYSTCTPLQVF